MTVDQLEDFLPILLVIPNHFVVVFTSRVIFIQKKLSTQISQVKIFIQKSYPNLFLFKDLCDLFNLTL